MIITWLNHRLSGYLCVEMSGFTPERFFNMCGVHGIEIWNVSDTGHSCRFYMTRKGFRQIKPIVRKSKVRLRIVKKFGLPFFLHRNRKRKYYAAGFASFFVILYLLSLFVWDIEFDGNRMYTYDTLLKFCETQEIRYGMPKSRIDCESLEEALRSEYPEITWVSARVSGTRLLVKIKENEVLSAIPAKDESPCDIVASKAGVITSMIVRQGVPKVSVGDTVEKGQLLVSGTLEIIGDSEEVVNTHYVHSDADIIARTEYQLTKQIPPFLRVDVETGRQRNGFYGKVLSWSMLLIRPKPEGTTWKLTMEEEQLHLFQNFYLPVYVGKIIGKEYISYERPYTEEEKNQAAFKVYEDVKKNLLEKGVQILENHVKILDNESLCQIAIDITAEEPIGSAQGMVIPGTDNREETNESNERN